MKKNHWEHYFEALKAQDWASAVRVLQELSETERDNAQVHLKLGDTYQRAGDAASAVAAYHRAARLLAEQGFYQKALALYKIILRLAPYDMDAMDRSRELLAALEASPAGASLQSAAAGAASEEVPAETPPVSSPSPAPESWLQSTSLAAESPAAPEFPVPALFSGMSVTDLGEVISEMAVRSYADGEKVVEEGDSGDSLYIIRSGTAIVRAHILGKAIDLALLGTGDVFGEVSFLSGRPRTADVIAQGPLEVYEVSRPIIEDVVAKNPAVLSRLQEFYESRARDTIRKAR